jgi:hypothetical protein
VERSQRFHISGFFGLSLTLDVPNVNRKNIDNESIKCIFVGYTGVKGYELWISFKN